MSNAHRGAVTPLEEGKLFESELSSWVIMANPTERR